MEVGSKVQHKIVGLFFMHVNIKSNLAGLTKPSIVGLYCGKKYSYLKKLFESTSYV